MEFRQLEALQRRLRELKSLHSKSLSKYFVDATNSNQGIGFRHLWDETIPSDPKKKAYSHASTATCIASLTNTGAWWLEKDEVGKPWWEKHTEALLTELCSTEPKTWNSAELGKGNPFTVAFSLEGLRELDNSAKYESMSSVTQSHVKSIIGKAESLLVKNLQVSNETKANQFAEVGAAHIAFYPPTSFLTQLVVRSLGKDNLKGDLRKKVEDWCRRQVEHELALLNTSLNLRDPLSLAYAVTAFLALAESDNLAPVDARLIERAVECFFASQLPDGSWPRSKPLHHYPRFGNAYCYEYETLAQLLQVSHIELQLIANLEKLELCVTALNRTANQLPNGGCAWPSGHHPHLRGAESWSTASVYQFVHHLDRLVAEAIRRHTFAYVGLPYSKPNETKTFKDEFKPVPFLDSRFLVEGVSKSLRVTIQDLFLRPVLREIKQLVRGEPLSKEVPVSAIFFGPPGTSKTELAKFIALHLGWPRLDIDPSQLFRGGLEQLQSESKRLFDMIALLERTVVFFDEFDEMVRERTSDKSDLMSRFLTTAMLPQLSRIADRRQIVFLLATNHIEDFDFAISRPGRFDMLLPVMPPSLDEKLNFAVWQAFGGKVTSLLKEPVDAHDGLSIRDVLEALTFAEFKSLFRETENVTDEKVLRDRIKAAWSNATLNKPRNPKPDGPEDETLREFYLQQSERRTRIPKQTLD